MFTQFRQAVENLAPQPRQGSNATASDEHHESASRSSSLDSHARPSSPLSSSQLAESALLNLRKSLATQRAGSPVTSQKPVGVHPTGRSKSTLEDRLRAATFAIGEASNTTSPDVSTRASPSPIVAAADYPLSPSSTPLPSSPPLSPAISATTPTPPIATVIATTSPPPEAAPEVITPTENEDNPTDATSRPASPEPTEVLGLAAQTEEPLDTAPPEVAQTPEIQPVSAAHSSNSANVEGLQERLKQVEQRFTGTYTSTGRHGRLAHPVS